MIKSIFYFLGHVLITSAISFIASIVLDYALGVKITWTQTFTILYSIIIIGNYLRANLSTK